MNARLQTKSGLLTGAAQMKVSLLLISAPITMSNLRKLIDG